MIQSKKEFLSKPLRIAAIQFAQRPEDTMKVPALLEEGGFNTEQLLHAVGYTGYGLYDKSKHYDLIKKYVADCDRRGIRVIMYANAHMLPPGYYKTHPEWLQTKTDGTKAPYACVNSAWRDLFFQSIRDALEQNINGIFLDGPIFIAECCHCENCQKLFLGEFGHPMSEATHGELNHFKSEHIGRFVHDSRKVIDESGKDVALYANCLGLVENITGCTVDAVSPYVDLIGSEGGFLFYGNPNEVSIWHGSETAKYLESKSEGRQYVIFNAGNDQPWAREMHTPQETSILYGSTVANGANVWYGIHGLIDSFHTPGGEEAFKFNRYLAENEEAYTGTKRYANVALLWSHHSINAFPDDVAQTDFMQAESNKTPHSAGSFQKEFHGMSEMLFRDHCQFTIIDETCLSKGGLDGCDMLILPNTSCLSDAEGEEIRRFAENGGTLIATLESGMYDENGNRRQKSLFGDLFGIRSVDGLETCEAGSNYMQFNEDYVHNGSGTASAGFSTGTLRCTYEDGGEVLASAYYPMEGRYCAFNEKHYPCIVVRRCGKGRTVYISGGVGQTYTEYGLPEMKDAIVNLVHRFAPGDLSVKNAFATMEVEMRTQPGKPVRLIHFVNHTGFMRRPIEEFVPCRGMEVTLKTEKRVHRIHTLVGKQELPFEQLADGVRFRVDVENYELAVVEM